MKRLVQLAKIFGDPNRLNIFALIMQHKNLCVCEICDTLQLSQPLVSRHLKQMREANLVSAKQEGRWMVYVLTTKPDTFLLCWMQELQKHLANLPALVGCVSR